MTLDLLTQFLYGRWGRYSRCAILETEFEIAPQILLGWRALSGLHCDTLRVTLVIDLPVMS